MQSLRPRSFLAKECTAQHQNCQLFQFRLGQQKCCNFYLCRMYLHSLVLWLKKDRQTARPFKIQPSNYQAGRVSLAALSGSFFTSQVSFSIIVSPFSAVYLGHDGKAPPFGSPVRINDSSDAVIFSLNFFGLLPPPVWVYMRSVLLYQKQISIQWKARIRPS